MAGPLLRQRLRDGERISRERERGNAKKRGRKKRRRKRGAEGRQRAGKGSGEGERKDRWMKWVSAALRSWHKYQSRSSSSSMRVYTRRERNRLVINRLGRLGHSAKRSRSRPLEESLARPVVASRAVAPGPISRAPSCCARLADDN